MSATTTTIKTNPGTASIQQLQRLFSPRHIAVFGGNFAAEAVRQCRKLGFAGEIWPVHPTRSTVEGLPCYPDVAALPDAPDASFVAVPREATVEIVRQLAERGAGGAICYASGFAEVGAEGAALQAQLVANAGDMALVGPNCYGMLNYLDGVALWPDQHGGQRLQINQRGVAIVTQSGNIGLNLTMQRRGLPLAYLITVGNKAGDSMEAIIQALLHDPRVSAIGLHIEGLDDVAAFSRVALQALGQGVPLVALKAGASALGAQTAMSHTSSLAGPDALYDALFARCGVARVREPAGLVETLKFLHVHGPLRGKRVVSASCSGGEASLMADLAQAHGLDMPALPPAAYARMHAVLGDKVNVANPLDYHTYIWGNQTALTECFNGLMDCGFDAHILVLDYPRLDHCSAETWGACVDAFAAAAQAHRTQRSGATLLASLPEDLPEAIAQQLIAQGVAPMQGLDDCVQAIAHAAAIGAAQARLAQTQAIAPVRPLRDTLPLCTLLESEGKAALAHYGVPIPRGQLVNAQDAPALAQRLGFPVVVKAMAEHLAHKTEAGAVQLNVADAAGVAAAVQRMAGLSTQFLVEEMATGVVAEMIVGIQRDAQFGLTLTLGAGGVLVELLQDAATLLLPASAADIEAALASLKTWPLLQGFRGRPIADVPALVQAIQAICTYAQAHAEQLVELDVNPILVRAQGQGVLAVDALVRLHGAAEV